MLQNIKSILKEKNRTSVFVAHRLRTIYDSDQILVLKDGHVAEQGSHRELLEENGIYAQLWHGMETNWPSFFYVHRKLTNFFFFLLSYSPGNVAGA